MGSVAVSRPQPRRRARVVSRLPRRRGTLWLLRRVAKAALTIFVVTSLTFFMVRLLPGDPVDVYVQTQIAQYGFTYDDAVAQASSLFAFDSSQPLLLQYLDYLSRLARGDLGQSILSPGVPVTEIIFQYLPWTLFSVGTGLLLAIIFGVLLGMLMAYRRAGFLDDALSALGSVLYSIPNYLFAIMLIVFLGVRLGWLPITDMRGALTSGQDVEFSLAFVRDAFYHASLPILTYMMTGIGTWMLLMKSSTVAALDEDYVTAARARGIRPGRIAATYVGRNAILPLFTQMTIAIGFVVGGSFLVEPIFVYQGIGYILFTAIQRRDYPLMQGIFLMITVSVVIATLLADILYSRLDPRIRTSGGEG